jgi:hypothetical protein
MNKKVGFTERKESLALNFYSLNKNRAGSQDYEASKIWY